MVQGTTCHRHRAARAYNWFWRGLPIGRERHNAAAALAKRAAELLRREPDVKGIGKDPAVLCYNLLGLCAALDYPDDLAEPLDEMLAAAIAGDWQDTTAAGVAARFGD